MNEAEQKLHRQFKLEADGVLFENLHFDSRLREGVLGRIVAEKRERIILRKWFHQSRKIWMYGASAAVAGILGLLLVSSPLFHDGAGNEVTPAPVAATGETFAQTVQSWSPQTYEEAIESFGGDLLVPSYTPDRLPLSGITASGTEKGKADQVVFSYMYGDKSFIVMADKGATALVYDDFKKVDINGSAGYLKEYGAGAELHWHVKGIHYSINGVISGVEAVKVAQSMK